VVPDVVPLVVPLPVADPPDELVPDVPVLLEPDPLPEPIIAFVSMYEPLPMLLELEPDVPDVPLVPLVLDDEPLPPATQPVTVTVPPAPDRDDEPLCVPLVPLVPLCAPTPTTAAAAIATVAAFHALRFMSVNLRVARTANDGPKVVDTLFRFRAQRYFDARRIRHR
jgi:hypothetical protein